MSEEENWEDEEEEEKNVIVSFSCWKMTTTTKRFYLWENCKNVKIIINLDKFLIYVEFLKYDDRKKNKWSVYNFVRLPIVAKKAHWLMIICMPIYNLVIYRKTPFFGSKSSNFQFYLCLDYDLSKIKNTFYKHHLEPGHNIWSKMVQWCLRIFF